MKWKDLEEISRGLILRHYPGIRLQELKTSVRITGLRAEI
jgi:hypothetical protein